MNDPHFQSHAGRCGCSAKPAVEAAVTPSTCCSGTPVTAEQTAGSATCCAGDKAADGAATVTDPVCGMTIDSAKTAHHAEHAGQSYHFCSAGCRTKFVAKPDAYLGDKPKPEAKGNTRGDLDVPDAPANSSGGTGNVPDLRYGTRTGRAVARR